MSPNVIFFDFLKKIGFEMTPNLPPFKKCKVGYKTYSKSRFGSFTYNITQHTITRVVKTFTDNNGINEYKYEIYEVINNSNDGYLIKKLDKVV